MHVDVHGEYVSYVMAGCNVVATLSMADTGRSTYVAADLNLRSIT